MGATVQTRAHTGRILVSVAANCELTHWWCGGGETGASVHGSMAMDACTHTSIVNSVIISFVCILVSASSR